ncbi:hypothetical protein MPSEU_000252900 [Mayamaea pseudoterrestris]|nr:hypothetical protein MPSEU_000252900 [Mayamaea pseudoterrestris]
MANATFKPLVVSRKRALTFIGLTAFMSMPMHQASPMSRQHRVPPASRQVSYMHTLQNGERRLLEPFFAPLIGERIAALDDRRLIQANSRASEIVADATIEHPDDVFYQLGKEQLRSSKHEPVKHASRRTSSLRQLENDAAKNAINEPTDYDKAASRTASVQQQDEINERAGDFVNANIDGESAPNATDFNITSTTVFNVSDYTTADLRALNQTFDQEQDIATIIYTDSERIVNATNGHDERFHPIRIRAFLSEQEGGAQYLSNEEHEILMQNIVKPALLAWSAALRVDPVRGNLTVDKSQLIDSVSCGPGLDTGLPSVVVPKKHLTQGIERTDMIVYLDLGFVNVERGIPRESAEWNATSTLENMTSYWSDLSNLTSSKLAEFESGENVTRDDAFLHIRPPQQCTGEYLAASSFCSTDQYDRPTAAILHICIGDDFFDVKNIKLNIMTVMHELGHALGFNSVSLAHFRRSDGTPITPRVNGSVPETLVECTGPGEYGRTFANITLPSADILQFRTVRGGVRVAEVVSPSVRQVVRNHFNCQELPGAELESGEFLPLYENSSYCIGDHWERRLFKMDIMNPLIEDLEYTPRISTITLAYFADSGWYQVDLSRATHAAGWGRGAGCPFIESTCIDSEGKVPTGYEAFFCNESPSFDADGYATQLDGCTSDLTRKATCSMGQYSGSLPFEYQYFNFTYGSNVGGSDRYMDYCPVYAGFTNGLCADPNNEALIRVDQMERFGDRNSRCISGKRQLQSTALCLRIACVVEDQSFRIQVDGVWRSCARNGTVIVTKSGDRVICPDPVRVCPTFYCVLDCLGTKRVCDYDQGKCVCDGSLLQDMDCDGELDDPFYHPTNASNLPGQDSPLSDYYVPTARQLQNESSPLLGDWEIVAVTFGGLLALFVAYLIWKRSRAPLGDVTVQDGFDDPDAETTNPDKLKMMASVVVDLRMNERNLRGHDALGERASETDQSMTDTDGGGSHVSNLSIEIDDAENEIFAPIDPDEPLPCPSIVRRRGKQDR